MTYLGCFTIHHWIKELLSPPSHEVASDSHWPFFILPQFFSGLPYFVFVTFLRSLPLQDLVRGECDMSLLQVLAAGPFSFVTPSCGGAVDGYLQWCTTFVWTSQGTDVAFAHSFIIVLFEEDHHNLIHRLL